MWGAHHDEEGQQKLFESTGDFKRTLAEAMDCVCDLHGISGSRQDAICVETLVFTRESWRRTASQ